MSTDIQASPQSLAPAGRNPGVFQVSAADVVQPTPPALPRLQSFEELGLQAFQKAVEEELSRDEKPVWLGRPSHNQTVNLPKTPMMVVGGICLGFALVLPVLFHGLPIIFPVVLVLFGVLFFFAPKLFNGAKLTTGYNACYV